MKRNNLTPTRAIVTLWVMVLLVAGVARATARFATPTEPVSGNSASGAKSVAGTWGLRFDSGGTQSKFMRVEQTRRVWVVELLVRRLYALDVVSDGKNLSFTRVEIGAHAELYADYFVLRLSPNGEELTGTRRTLSVEGDRPVWKTDKVEFTREAP